MKSKRIVSTLLVVATALCFTYGIANADQLKIGIMQDQKGAAKKYQPLVDYFKTHGIDISFVGTSSYTAAAEMFSDGKVDAMFSGSGVAGSMIIKDVAEPVARPLSEDGNSTYWAVILAPKGSPEYTGSADYFTGKKVIFCSLASSGEFYFRSIAGHTTAGEMMMAASHGAAIDALSRGAADVAVVKNRVWDKMKNKYPDLQVVGSDKGENPDGTLIVSKKLAPAFTKKVTSALLNLTEDQSPEAAAVRSEMKIRGYIQTTSGNFDHTLALLKQAGVKKSFDFKF